MLPRRPPATVATTSRHRAHVVPDKHQEKSSRRRPMIRGAVGSGVGLAGETRCRVVGAFPGGADGLAIGSCSVRTV